MSFIFLFFYDSGHVTLKREYLNCFLYYAQYDKHNLYMVSLYLIMVALGLRPDGSLMKRYKCECLHSINKGIYRRHCKENKKIVFKKIWSQRASDMHNTAFPLKIFSYFVQDCLYYFVQSFSNLS